MPSLIRKGDFKDVFDKGRRFSSRFIVLYARPNGLTFSRLGLAVSRKIGNAVVRNRIRRRLREAMRILLGEKPACYDFVIVARSASADAAYADLSRHLSKFISGLINEKGTDSADKGV